MKFPPDLQTIIGSTILLLLSTVVLLAASVNVVSNRGDGRSQVGRQNASFAGDASVVAFGDAYFDNFTCIDGCSCYLTDYTRSRYAVACSGSSIRSLPAFLTEDLHQIESMTLYRTSIAQIDSFRMFRGLTHLNLNQSQVQSLDSSLMSTFPTLERLQLAENRLQQVGNLKIFQYISLREIDFSANQLTGFDPSGSMTLQVLNLRRNLLANLNDIGANYGTLRRLDVSENRLTLEGLSSWDPPTELEVLDLSGNRLKISGTGKNATFFQRLSQLQQLSLSGNQLDSLGPITNWLPPGSKLWKLSLGDNPFVCSCSLYRDKERLARQGVVISDSPACRLANGTEYALTRLGSWACADVEGGGRDLASAGSALPTPILIALIAGLSAAVTLSVVIFAGIWACRRNRHRQRHREGDQRPPSEPEYPYNNSSVKSTNLTGSQASIGTCRSALPYAFDPQRSRVFTKKLAASPEQLHQQAMMGQRCQSEQVLGSRWSGRGSTPLPPIPDSVRVTQMLPRPEDYVDMENADYQPIAEQPATYDQLHPRQPHEGYVDMQIAT